MPVRNVEHPALSNGAGAGVVVLSELRHSGKQLNTTAIVTMILAALLGFGRVLDGVESLKEGIIKMIRSFVEVRDELDRAKRSHRPKSTQGDQLEPTPDHTKELPDVAPGGDRKSAG
ncbi:hypothetical protein ACFYY1_23330 [Streptomyces sp. NPDC001890]|uniref:hypothetical protein n=1 Tax=Streptomyces sp. NPDC001890 TaxID=3364620 RepID=UPI00369D091E